MKCRVFPLKTLNDYKYVVILSIYKEKIMLSRHKRRTTWETQGGHIEVGETPETAAERELYEESGAVKYRIKPIFDYWAGDDGSGANGMVFLAQIDEVGRLPESEMKEVSFFERLPENLTYPEITPVLFQNAFAET